MWRVLKYVAIDIVKNKIIIVYSLVLALISWSAFGLEDSTSKGILTVLNIILLIVPMVSILFSTIYVYNSNEFIELLVSHPIRREVIWKSLFLGLSMSMIVAFLIGVGIPILIYAELSTALIMICSASFLTAIFISLAFLSCMLTRDKSKGIGLSLIIWLFFALMYDGLVLYLYYQFSDYPIEKPMVIISALNPIDLSRILVLLKLDISAMVGYTGAIFKKTFGSDWGLLVSFLLLILWSILPFYISLKIFKFKDL